MAFAAALFALVSVRGDQAMRKFVSIARSVLATFMMGALAVLPSCASMGGGGMKGMFSDAPVTARDVVG
jgi:hypothetical protein